MNGSLSGVLVPAVTPFDRRLAPDATRFAAYCRWLLDHGGRRVGGVSGTTGEATSLGLAERKDLLAKLVEAGIAPAKLLPGTGLSALPRDCGTHAPCGGIGLRWAF